MMVDRIDVPTSSLNAMIELVEKSVPSKSPLPVLSNIKLELSENLLRLTATDFVTMSSASIPLDLPFDFDPICVLVNAKKMSDFVSSLDTQRVMIEPNMENHQVVLRTKGRRTTLSTIPGSEYPATDFDEPEKKLSIPPDAFGLMMKMVAGYHLKYNDEQLTIYRGIEFVVDPKGVKATGCTAFQAATVTYGSVLPVSQRNIIVGDQLTEVAKVLCKCDDLSIGIANEEDNKVFFYGSMDNVSITVAIQVLAEQNKYMNISANIAKTMELELVRVDVYAKDLLSVLEPIESYDGSDVVIRVDLGKITIIANDPNVGSYQATVDLETNIESLLEEELVFCVNRKMLTKALKNIALAGSDYATIFTNDAVPLVIIAPKSIHDNYSFDQAIGKIVMPEKYLV